ncbi:host-nuclease inhibitor Gam family protein [bacterium]|nr:host-nuclease inhibitor Gam family protein [bacterium]
MTDMTSFIDELIEEQENHDAAQTEAHADLLLLEISNLQQSIADTFTTAEEEQTLIQKWALSRTTKMQDRIDRISQYLETFMTERHESSGEKTLNLAHGTLRIRKSREKVEITDLGEFLKHARPEMLRTQPESSAPDMAGIRSWMKMSGKVPPGVEVTPGKNEFSIKIEEQPHGTDTKG